MPKVASLKVAHYDNFSKGKSQVAYVLLPDQRCVFSGLTHMSRGTSTINAAEAIIASIAKVAKIDPKVTTFYDLQTSVAYGQDGKPTGKFHYSELLLDFSEGPCHVSGWVDENCPDEVISLFSAHIGPNPEQVSDGILL